MTGADFNLAVAMALTEASNAAKEIAQHWSKDPVLDPITKAAMAQCWFDYAMLLDARVDDHLTDVKGFAEEAFDEEVRPG